MVVVLSPTRNVVRLNPEGRTPVILGSPAAAPAVSLHPNQGVRGPSGFFTEVTASEALGGHRVVTSDGFHSTQATLDRIAGISVGATLVGEKSGLVYKGEIQEPSWNWVPEAAIYAGDNGVLTQMQPLTGPVRRVAWAVSANAINVDIYPVINRL